MQSVATTTKNMKLTNGTTDIFQSYTKDAFSKNMERANKKTKLLSETKVLAECGCHSRLFVELVFFWLKEKKSEIKCRIVSDLNSIQFLCFFINRVVTFVTQQY